MNCKYCMCCEFIECNKILLCSIFELYDLKFIVNLICLIRLLEN